MTSFFPDLNVWMAMSVDGHRHTAEAWRWRRDLHEGDRLLFARYTHVGLVRLLSTPAIMGEKVLTLARAWGAYDQWLADPSVVYYPEPPMIEERFRLVSRALWDQAAAKAVGDCYLLAYAQETRSTLVTFDKALLTLAQKAGCRAVRPA